MKGWRTIIVQAVVGLLGLFEAMDWTEVLGDQRAGIFLIALSIINAGLRAVTSTPLGRKG